MIPARRVIAGLLVVLAWSVVGTPLFACPICFKMEQGPVSEGVVAAVLVLMGVTVGVLGCFARFVVRVARFEPVEPVEPVEPAEPVEPVEPVEPARV